MRIIWCGTDKKICTIGKGEERKEKTGQQAKEITVRELEPSKLARHGNRDGRQKVEPLADRRSPLACDVNPVKSYNKVRQIGATFSSPLTRALASSPKSAG